MNSIRRLFPILILLSLTGCSILRPDSSSADTSAASEVVSDEATDVTTTDESDADTATDDASDADSLWESIPGESDTEAENEDTTYLYAYQQLSGTDRTVYDELSRMITSRVETNLSTQDKDRVKEIYDMVLADHPEFFYIGGYTLTSHTRGGALEYLSARANYDYDEETTAEYERLLGTAVDSILLQAPTDGTDYEKVRFCYEYLIRNTSYDASAENNQNILSVLLGHSSVCSGYAKAMQYLLAKLDVPATLVTGESQGRAHAWDLVQIDGEYYYVDPTWGDAQFTGAASGDVWITYDYLNITTADILTNHTFDDTIPLPECTARAANYYVMEGLWFDSFSQQRLHEIVNAAYNSGDLTIRWRCADAAVYQEMHDALIANSGIYEYLYGSTSVTYTTSDTLYTFSINFN